MEQATNSAISRDGLGGRSYWGSRATSAALDQAVQRIYDAEPDKVQKIAASQIELLILASYDTVLEQGKVSFRTAWGLSVVGIVFLLVAVGLALAKQPVYIAVLI